MQLTRDEQKVLDSVYGRQVGGLDGYNPNKLDAVLELNEHEQKFFAGKNFVSAHFFAQTLYKVRGNISPITFNRAVNRLLNETDNLRANFCNVGTRTLKVIQSNVRPEIIFRNLTQTDPDDLNDEFRKILAADMRRDVDIRHAPLIRFAVYRTGDDEFAVLITAAQIVADSFDVAKFLANVTGTSFQAAPKISDDLSPNNQDAIRDYWAKVLDHAPRAASLPFESASVGTYRQKAFHTTIDVDILSDLRRRAQSNRVMLTAILQSAWGFMLQLTNRRRDVLFCQILSADDATLNVIPVRVISDNDQTVEQTVRKQFRQLVVSQPYSRVDWTTLGDLSGGRKLFDHFLSFKEFQSAELNYVAAGASERGTVVAKNSWDARGMKLGAYFRYSEKNLSIGFLYDERQFRTRGVERLCELYGLILRQMLSDWNAKFTDFMARLGKRVDLLEDDEKISREDERLRIRDFLSQLPILQGRFAGTIELFENQAELLTLYEGDRISGDALKKFFVFVVDGKLVRNADTGDGWYDPLDVVGKNAFINPTNFLARQRLTLSAEVLTERAELLTIPRDVLTDALRKNSEVAESLMTYALEQMERYQLLWLQS